MDQDMNTQETNILKIKTLKKNYLKKKKLEHNSVNLTCAQNGILE